MRNVVASLFMSVDGVVESPDQWQFDHFDEDMMEAMVKELRAIDTILLGRVTYEEWEPYWTTSSDEPFASFINNTPKYVVSTTLDNVKWGTRDNITLIQGDVTAEINKLKQQPGQNIAVNGSPTLVRSLLYSDVLDRLMLMIHPVVAGSGKHLFKDNDDLKRLKLVDSKTTRSGNVLLTYQPREKA